MPLMGAPEPAKRGDDSNVSVRAPAVFISYASQDAETAKRICDALRAAGIEVWFDQSELRGGDIWDQRIRQQIRDCALFLAIISANTDARPEGYFRLEWKLAVDRSHLMADDEPFLLPIVVDGTLDANARVPDRFRQAQWTRLPEGATPPAFVDRVSGLLAHDPHVSRPALVVSSPTSAHRRSLWSRFAPLFAAVVAIACGYLALERFVPSKHVASPAQAPAQIAPAVAPPQSAVTEKSIAVLPFVDMSEKHDQEYFSDGLSEELINQLAQNADLKVIARTSSFQFKAKSEDIRLIAGKLGVANLLEGSVRKSGDRLRITAQLIRASDGVHVWSTTYDRKLNDVFAVQSEIAGTVAQALNVALSGGRSAATGSVQNVAAYNLLLKGDFFYFRSTKGDNERAIEQYQQAVKLDPSYSLAWAKLGRVYVFQDDLPLTPSEAESKARDALQRALALDPSSVTAHRWLARVYEQFDWDWPAAQAEYERAVALDPDSQDGRRAHRELAVMTADLTGRCDPLIPLALEELARNPLDADSFRWAGFVYSCSGQLEASAAAYRRVIELNPDELGAHANYAITLLRMNKAADALVEVEREADESERLPVIARIYWTLGRRNDADAMLRQCEREFAHFWALPIAGNYAWRGESDVAFVWLERAYTRRDPGLVGIKLDWRWTSLHSDPRYKALLRKLKLPE
jgi:TolB-like protein/Tfp pilus assembly protein PilF